MVLKHTIIGSPELHRFDSFSQVVFTHLFHADLLHISPPDVVCVCCASRSVNAFSSQHFTSGMRACLQDFPSFTFRCFAFSLRLFELVLIETSGCSVIILPNQLCTSSTVKAHR